MQEIYNTTRKKQKKLSIPPVIIYVITILFFGTMAFLTFKARDIHEKGLPHVKHQKLEIIPKDAIHNNQVFIIKTMVKNGEERTFAEARVIKTGEETKEGYKIASGTDMWDSIITFSDRELKDGAEVVIIK